MKNEKETAAGKPRGKSFQKGYTPWNKGVGGKRISGTNRSLLNMAKRRDDFSCQICGLREPEIVEVDHIRPKAIRPDLTNDIDNLMTICPNCHARKTIIDAKNIITFRKGKNENRQ